MKKIFTLIAVVAFLAACGGNANKKANVTEEQAIETEAVVDTCNMECAGECEKASSEGEAVAEGAEAVVAE